MLRHEFCHLFEDGCERIEMDDCCFAGFTGCAVSACHSCCMLKKHPIREEEHWRPAVIRPFFHDSHRAGPPES